MSNKKPIFILFCCTAFMAFISAQPIYNVSGTLSGSSEVPPIMSTATGTVTGTYDQGNGFINLTVTYNGLNSVPSFIAIHDGAIGSNGAPIVNLMNPATTSGISSGSYLVLNSNEAALLAGNTYVNIHTVMLASGELRAQLSLVPARAIPTLSQWGFIILAILFMILGVIAVRKEIWTFSKI